MTRPAFRRATAWLTTLLLACGLIASGTISAVAAETAATGSISGTVSNHDGAAIDYAWVSLYRMRSDGSWGPAASLTVTSTDGGYTFAGLAAGTYTLRFETSVRYHLDGDEYWQDQATLAGADAIVVDEGAAVGGIDAVIGPAAAIGGTVTDADSEALAGVRVTLRYEEGDTVTTMTDTLGVYRLDGLRTGRATLLFEPPMGSGLATEWYGDVYLLGNAYWFTLHAGVDFRTVDAQLELPRVDATNPSIVGIAAVGSTLTAVAGDWSPGTELDYLWLADDVHIEAAEGDSITIAPSLVAKEIRVVVTGSKAGFTSVTRTSAPTSRVLAGTLDAPPPVITGELAVGSIIDVSTAGWTAGASFEYQWYSGSSAIAGATNASLTLTSALKGAQLQVLVTGFKDGYGAASSMSALTDMIVVPGRPSILGVPFVGGMLTAAPGTWMQGTTFAYQWYADGIAIADATKATFAPTVAQDGQALTVQITARKPSYATVIASSTPTMKVMRYSVPTIAGTNAVGYRLTANPQTWTRGTSFTYQWYASGVAISGATQPTLVLTSAHRDKQITVRIAGRLDGHASVASMSTPTMRVAATSAPVMSGVFMVGSTLTASAGSWTPGTAFTYQWYADGTPISGGTRSTLVLTSTLQQKQVSVTIIGRKSGWTSIARDSLSSPRIALSAVPSVSGVVMVGETLRAVPGTWTTGTAFTYQWYANGTAVAGATGPTLNLTKSFAARAVSVRVVGSLDGYQTIARSSAVTVAVRSGKSAPLTRDSCPAAWPIKGNQTTRHTADWIYHVPGGLYYAVTDPEECFATEAAAVANGYRRSQQ